jgi:hypothetical protein
MCHGELLLTNYDAANLRGEGYGGSQSTAY